VSAGNVTRVAQFLAVCRASTLAEELCISSPFSGRVPSRCGSCCEASPKPSERYESAGHQSSSPIFLDLWPPWQPIVSTPIMSGVTIVVPTNSLYGMRWRPRWHPKHQPLLERPHVSSQSRRHRRCTRLPHLGGTGAVGCLGHP